ncbi:MAG: TetR family transcriptional regulator [Marmoricola sp.]|nr:TetR family transcriptional regulator [Marmoricola sp.]
MTSTREPQQDRSRVTRANLLSATIDCLADSGLAGTTVSRVASRAGVSRGAAQHHFASRDELIAAASVQVVDEVRATIEERGARLRAAPDRTFALLEILLEAYAGTAGRAATAVWVAASADPALRERVIGLAREFDSAIHQIIRDVLGSDDTQPGVRESILLTTTMLRGIGTSALVVDPGTHWLAPLEQWAGMLESVPGAVRGGSTSAPSPERHHPLQPQVGVEDDEVGIQASRDPAAAVGEVEHPGRIPGGRS